jgi:hypothetical protein
MFLANEQPEPISADDSKGTSCELPQRQLTGSAVVVKQQLFNTKESPMKRARRFRDD